MSEISLTLMLSGPKIAVVRHLPPDEKYLLPITLEHGRIEGKKCLICRNLERIRTAMEWKDLSSIIRIDVHKIDKRPGKASDEMRFNITSLTGDAKALHVAMKDDQMKGLNEKNWLCDCKPPLILLQNKLFWCH